MIYTTFALKEKMPTMYDILKSITNPEPTLKFHVKLSDEVTEKATFLLMKKFRNGELGLGHEITDSPDGPTYDGISMWCKTNLKGGCVPLDLKWWSFENCEDATLFSLRYS